MSIFKICACVVETGDKNIADQNYILKPQLSTVTAKIPLGLDFSLSELYRVRVYSPLVTEESGNGSL